MSLSSDHMWRHRRKYEMVACYAIEETQLTSDVQRQPCIATRSLLEKSKIPCAFLFTIA